MCCLDTWFSVWRQFDTWIWALFLFIQASMVVFLVVHSRTDKTFQPVFFVFFVAVTVVDAVVVYSGTAGHNPSAEESAYDEYCCAADWSAWRRFETWIWAVFMLVQVTMTVFLVVHGRRVKSFRQAFYVFFVAVTFVDCVLVLWRPPMLEYTFDKTIFGTELNTPYVEDPLRKNVMAYESPLASINYATLRVLIPVFSHAQPLFLAATAVNRLTALGFPLKHAAIWSARRVALVVVALALTAALLGAGTSVVTVIQQIVVCSVATEKASEDLNCHMRGTFYRETIPKALLILIPAICCVVCFALNIASITMIVVLRSTGKLRQRVPELRLFVHSLFMFLLQMFVAFQDTVRFMDNIQQALGNFGINGFATEHPHSTEWLAGVKGTRIPIPEGVVFMPGCTVFEDPYVDLPMCSGWYRILVGELRLREYPDKFTVRSLLQTLLCVSGSVFFLIISGHVRNAYISFYFGCLQRKRKQSSSVSVVQVAPARQPIVSAGRATL